MPYLLIRTNREVSQEEQLPLLKRCSADVAQMLGKPERFVMASIESSAALIFGGDSAPCAYVELKSIGLPEEQTATYSAQLCRLIGDGLDIPSERIYIEFAAAARHMWGWDEGTF